MTKVNPYFIDELKQKYGGFDITACYNCGTCTATCPLSKEGIEFPRKIIRYAILGVKDRVVFAPELWLCYYCGECTKTCPRGADPAGFMAAARRNAIAELSFLKIGRVFFSKIGAVLATIVLSLMMLLGIVFNMTWPPTRLDTFVIDSFIPIELVHKVGLGLGLFIGLMAVYSLVYGYIKFRPTLKSIAQKRNKKITFLLWIKAFFIVLFRDLIAEKHYSQCEDKTRYIAHLMMFYGFIGLFGASILDFLHGETLGQYIYIPYISEFVFYYIPYPTVPRLLGIIAGILLMISSTYFIVLRITKKEPYAGWSHISDWIFIILMFLSGLTGFILLVLEFLNIVLWAYIFFVIHVIVVWDLLVSATFTKFAHAGYRPFVEWLIEIYY